METDECVLWPFAVRRSSGYGAHSVVINDVKKNVDSHRYICEQAHGPAPSADDEAAHSCGRKLCCNKRHLRWAPRLENLADAKQHGTLRGGGLYRQKLFVAERAAIRDSTESLVTLAARYGMEAPYIGRVRREERRNSYAGSSAGLLSFGC